MLQLSDITDSLCNEINITVSGYNGLDGENYLTSIVQSSGTINILCMPFHITSNVIIIVLLLL